MKRLFFLLVLPLLSGCFLFPTGDTSIDTSVLAYVSGMSGSVVNGADDLDILEAEYVYALSDSEVPYGLWNDVRRWAENNGYTITGTGLPTPQMGGKLFTSQAVLDDDHPVTNVHFLQVVVWCNAYTGYCIEEQGAGLEYVYTVDGQPLRDASDTSVLDSLHADLTKNGYRLPTFAEWEYAARFIKDTNTDGDLTTAGEYYPVRHASGSDYRYNGPDSYSFVEDFDGDQINERFDDVAVYDTDSTSPIRSKRPNPLGLYDMSGNVAEICYDRILDSGIYSRPYVGGSYDINENSVLHLTVGMTLEVHEKMVDTDLSLSEDFNAVGFRLAKSL